MNLWHAEECTQMQSDTPTGKLLSSEHLGFVCLAQVEFGRAAFPQWATNEFISTPLLFLCPLHIFARVVALFFFLVSPSLSLSYTPLFISLLLVPLSPHFPILPPWTSSLYLHRWFQWLLWVLIIPSITVGKCAIKVDSYSALCASIFMRVSPDFRGSGVFQCTTPSFPLLPGMCEGHPSGINTFYFPDLSLCRDSY